MHKMTRERLREIIGYYTEAKRIASDVEADLLPQLEAAEIDGYKVLGRLRKAAADFRNLKAP